MQHLDPKHTACFLAAVQAGTVRAAAEQLGIEPSTVSRNLSALEGAMAVPLLERGRAGVRPTDAGTLLIAFLRQQEGALDLLQSEFDALRNMKRGKVAIAVGEGFVGDLFDSALRSFARQYPDITLSLSVGSTDHVLEQITSERAHLGLAYNVTRDPQIRVEISKAQPMVALVRKGGRFDDTALNLEMLAQMPCAIPPKGFGIGAMITLLEAQHGLRLRAVVETGAISALKGFVRNDMGYTILPRFVVEGELSDGTLSAHPISSSAFTQGVSSLIRREGRKLPQAANLVLQHLRRMSAFR